MICEIADSFLRLVLVPELFVTGIHGIGLNNL
jgi:hypothetical protein